MVELRVPVDITEDAHNPVIFALVPQTELDWVRLERRDVKVKHIAAKNR